MYFCGGSLFMSKEKLDNVLTFILVVFGFYMIWASSLSTGNKLLLSFIVGIIGGTIIYFITNIYAYLKSFTEKK